MFNIETLRSKSLSELTKISKDLGVKIPRNSTKETIVFAILDFQASNPKVTKEYFNATENTMEEKQESPKPKAKAPAKKKVATKTVEKPAELFEETTPEAKPEEVTEPKVEAAEKPECAVLNPLSSVILGQRESRLTNKCLFCHYRQVEASQQLFFRTSQQRHG